MDLVIATRSPGKLAEIRRILSVVTGLRVMDLAGAGIAYDPAEDHIEPHDTFEENAVSKASFFHALCGLPTVADDSGLEVDALGGGPGVRSKRFAPDADSGRESVDEANNRHLLRALDGVPPSRRGARFVCVAALVEPDRTLEVFRGETPGVILDAKRGRGGFGYDPVFLDPELGRTFAELSPEEKNGRSHRGRAFRALAAYLARRS